ncbi:MAG: hypothetical protein PVF13_07580, partial [Chromatiales bacterium]
NSFFYSATNWQITIAIELTEINHFFYLSVLLTQITRMQLKTYRKNFTLFYNSQRLHAVMKCGLDAALKIKQRG